MNKRVLVGAVFIFFFAACKGNETPVVKKDPWSMTMDECHQSGGHEISGASFSECKDNEFMYGHISGVHCSCICCGTNSGHPHLLPPYPALHEIPLPVRDKYAGDMVKKLWRNPFLVIGPDGIEIRGRGQFSRDQIEAELTKLPRSDWPYGRVVAIHFEINQPPAKQSRINLNLNKALSVLTKLRVPTELL